MYLRSTALAGFAIAVVFSFQPHNLVSAQTGEEAVIVSRFFEIDNEHVSANNVTAGETIKFTLELNSQVNRNLMITPMPIVESNVTGTPRCSQTYFPASPDRWHVEATYLNDFVLPAGETVPFSMNIMALEPGTYRINSAFAFSYTLANGTTINETYYGRCHTIHVSHGLVTQVESWSYDIYDTLVPVGIGAAIAGIIAFLTLRKRKR